MSSQPLTAPEPWGRRLCIALLGVALIATVLQSYGITTWPMADDEVPSLVEMGLLDVPAQAFSVPANQIGRLPRAVPVWYQSQRFLLERVPRSQLSFRLPSVVWGVLTSVLAFWAAARWRGLWFAAALALIMNASQLFVLLAQLDRFYSLPLLLLTAILVIIWAPIGGAAPLVAIAVLTPLAVLSHNVTVAVFALAFGASCLVYLLGRAPIVMPIRSGLAFAIAAAIYGVYLRPLVHGWNSTGNPTPVLISFAAHATTPALALALVGSWLALARPSDGESMIWWVIVLAGSLCLFQITDMTWNPRYFLFFLPAVWVLAAHGAEYVARNIGYSATGAVWYCCVALLLAPNLLSHYQDGSRHDYRRAAEVVLANDQGRDAILSDDAETISYYLPETTRRRLYVRTKVREFPASEFLLVARSNAWMPLPQIPGRRLDLLAEIYRRRFDQFSHILRVYRVAPTSVQ